MPDRDPPDCHAARQWLSASRDREAREDPAASAHLRDCADCGAWDTAVTQVGGALETALAVPRPDVAGPALVAWTGREEARTARRERTARTVLVAAGVSGVVLSLAALVNVLGDGNHALRDLLGFQLAFALGFLLCSRNPQRYTGALLPLTGAASVIVLLPSAAETAAADLHLLVEASHLPILLGLVGLVLLQDALRQGPLRRGGPPRGLRTMSA